MKRCPALRHVRMSLSTKNDAVVLALVAGPFLTQLGYGERILDLEAQIRDASLFVGRGEIDRHAFQLILEPLATNVYCLQLKDRAHLVLLV